MEFNSSGLFVNGARVSDVDSDTDTYDVLTSCVLLQLLLSVLIFHCTVT